MRLIDGEIAQSKIGAWIGGVLVFAGVALFLLGLTGNIGFKFNIGTYSGNLTNASPGALIAVLGTGIMVFYRLKATVRRGVASSAGQKPE